MRRYVAMVVFFAISFVAVELSVSYLQPLPVRQFNPPGGFSEQRAIQDIEVFARIPHPYGSAANLAVQNYLVDRLTALQTKPKAEILPGKPAGRAASANYILAKVPGLNSSSPIMLACHFDSVPMGPGTSDDGASVASLLEVARDLRIGVPLKNDVYLLITNKEELGSLGAKAFAINGGVPANVKLVGNFEARGSYGPSLMFETSDNNGDLITSFKKFAPHPVSSSIFPAVYHTMPNGTDFTIFKSVGLKGFNFAYINGIRDYHHSTDNLRNIDPRSLQSQGDNVLALAEYYGHNDYHETDTGDATFFVIPQYGMVAYGLDWAYGLAAATVLLFGALIVFMLRRRAEGKRTDVNLRSLGGAIVSAILALVFAMLVAEIVSRLAYSFFGAKRIVPDGQVYLVVLQSLSFGAVWLSIWATRKLISVSSHALSHMALWLAGSIALAATMPAASYILVLPLLFVAAAWILYTALPTHRLWATFVSLVAFSAAGFCSLILLTPILSLGFTALTLNKAPMILVLCYLVSGLFVPVILTITRADQAIITKEES